MCGLSLASALVSGVKGFDDLIVVIGESAGFLKSNGWLIVEHGHDQGHGVRQLFTETGFTDVETRRDYNRVERITLGCFCGSE